MVDWCRNKVSQLIEKLREYPILWDVRCTDDKNKSLKVVALGDISRSLHVPIEEVTKKLHSLKVQFSREYCRVRREKQRTGRTYVPKWYGYEQLLFLKDANTRHKKWPIPEEKDDCNDCTNSEDLSIVSINSIKEEYPMHTDDDDKDCANLHNHKPFLGPTLDTSGTTVNMQSQTAATEKTFDSQNMGHDEFVSFGLYIASKLRSINDPYLQALAKHNMNKVIFNIEMKQLEQSINQSKHPISLENYLQRHRESNSP